MTLYAEDALENERCHFYEIPIPRAFFEGSRSRDLVIAVSYMPAARTTRLDYKATQIEYRLVQAADFDRVRETFCANSDLSSISDVNNAVFKATARSKGTLQCDRWTIKRESAKRLENRLFVVVSRKDRGWAEDLASELEPYALAIQLRDHENEQAQHYVQIRETLALRVQQRQRARS